MTGYFASRASLRTTSAARQSLDDPSPGRAWERAISCKALQFPCAHSLRQQALCLQQCCQSLKIAREYIALHHAAGGA